MNEDSRFAFGELLTRYLEREERSANWLAKKVGVDRSTITRWRNGNTHPDTPDKIVKISRFLHLDQEEYNSLLKSCNFPSQPSPQSEPPQIAVSKPQLSVILNVIEPIRVYSNFGAWNYKGGPCPPLEGHINLGIVVENPSQFVAKFLKVDLEVYLLEHTRSKCERAVNPFHDEWYYRKHDRYYWHFRYDGTPDDVCLQDDDLPLGEVGFSLIMREESEDFNNMENEDYTSLEESVLKDPLISIIKSSSSNQILQQRICRIYEKDPAKDVYLIKCRTRAENFESSETEFTLKINWLNNVFPQLIISGKQTQLFDFNAYPDFSYVDKLKAALIEKIPIGSPSDDLLAFFVENSIPQTSAGKKLSYGFLDRLIADNVAILILKVPSSRKIQVINFLFDDSKHLKDITIDFHL